MKRLLMNNKCCALRLSIAAVLIFSGAATGDAWSQSDRQSIRKGNREFRSGKYQEAEIMYRRAAEVPKASPDTWFNLGNAVYKQDKFGDAAELYMKNASQNAEAVKKANSFYNLGNSLLSMSKIEESIEAYKQSLRLNPGNMEAKYNLAYAQDMLEKQDEDQQQQENDGGGEQDKDPAGDQQDDDQEGDDKSDESGQPDSGGEKDAGEGRPKGDLKISEEDARRLLEALAADEQAIKEKVQKDNAAAARIRTLKNW